jgi:uncharacterized damage-inducible protein DinB
MRSIERLLEQLNAAYGGPAWHGPALRELLDGVTEEDARAHPVKGAHSILELVAHATVWMDAVARLLRGDGRRPTAEEDWADLSKTSLAAVMEELEAAEGRLCDAVARLREEDLDHQPPGTRFTIYGFVNAAIDHNLYHAGQIALLKRALAS